MPNENEEKEEQDFPAKKELTPKYVNIGVRITDAHYIATFSHGPNRVFHNAEELLVAIEVEVKRLA